MSRAANQTNNNIFSNKVIKFDKLFSKKIAIHDIILKIKQVIIVYATQREKINITIK